MCFSDCSIWILWNQLYHSICRLDGIYKSLSWFLIIDNRKSTKNTIHDWWLDDHDLSISDWSILCNRDLSISDWSILCNRSIHNQQYKRNHMVFKMHIKLKNNVDGINWPNIRHSFNQSIDSTVFLFLLL